MVEQMQQDYSVWDHHNHPLPLQQTPPMMSQ
jgi:hypothetical protein